MLRLSCTIVYHKCFSTMLWKNLFLRGRCGWFAALNIFTLILLVFREHWVAHIRIYYHKGSMWGVWSGSALAPLSETVRHTHTFRTASQTVGNYRIICASLWVFFLSVQDIRGIWVRWLSRVLLASWRCALSERYRTPLERNEAYIGSLNVCSHSFCEPMKCVCFD